MQRKLVGNVRVGANATGRATLGRPRPGQVWTVRRVMLTAPNWVSGTLVARILVDGIEHAASQQGQNDVASGEPIHVQASQPLQIEWVTPANVQFTGALLQCYAEATIDQVP